MFKNVAGQKVAVYAWDAAAGAPKTGDANNITAQISKDFGTSAATDDTNPTELDATNHPGTYYFNLTQSETNADYLVITPKSTTANVVFRPLHITPVTAVTELIGSNGSNLTGIPWNSAWDAEVQSEVFDALDAAFTDSTSLTSNGLLDRIRILCWILRNKIEVTDANGNTVIYKDDSTTTAFSVNSMLTDNSTTTTRLRAA